MPGLALAHDAPESNQSKWVMADWMMDTFFIFSGLAFVASSRRGRPGTSTSSTAGGHPAAVEEEDYYTPEWALEEEEWADGDAER